MAIFSVAQTNKEDQIVADTNWEQESYREGCAYPREQARVRLKALDDELLRRKPKPESTEGRPWGQPLKKPEGAPLNLG